ncbi:hypothetical protein MNBD_GAMMA12-2215 [hydrothermal vent metagenome]|uniref:Transmembrane protein n=1 Tax=hydrothermal vent metagenome TaxID=652676 RepID=A0A3B0ZNX4_9ZZZZ
MDNNNSKKLPIKSILALAIMVPVRQYKIFLKALILPATILVFLQLLDIYVFSDFPDSSLILSLLYFLVYCYFAITCHRIVLLNEKPSGIVESIFSRRVLSFIGWLLILSIATGFAAVPFIIVLNFMFIDFNSSDNYFLLFILAFIPVIFFMAKLSLIFPAVAIDEQPKISWAWNATRNNGWRMFVVVGILPILFSWMQELIRRNDSIWLEDLVLSILSLIFLIIEISALSLSFKFFSDNPMGSDSIDPKKKTQWGQTQCQ